MQDVIGKRFNRLTILEYSHTNCHRKRVYKCVCDCGNTKNVVYGCLTSGSVKSCGCLKIEKTSVMGQKIKGKENII